VVPAKPFPMITYRRMLKALRPSLRAPHYVGPPDRARKIHIAS